MLVTLAAPRGINKQIFLWGIELVSDYIQANAPDVDVSKINLTADEELHSIFPSRNRIMGMVQLQMTKKARQIFLGSADFISAYTTQVAAMGEDFIDLAEEHNMFKARHKAELIEQAREAFPALKKDFDDYLTKVIEQEKVRANGKPHIWGITTYDHTVFNVLYLAKKIAEVDPDATIILGGDYWDYKNSRQLVADLDWIDGVVVGYGEDPLLEIINRHKAGEEVRDMLVRGLTNRAVLTAEETPDSIFVKNQDIKKADEGSGVLQTMAVPDDYRSGKADIPFQLVHRDLHQPGVYRVLTQRGCSFGGCRFCTQIDRMIHFPFSIQEVTRQLEEELRNNPPEGPISISIDNDEMTPPDLLYLVDFFEKLPYEIESVVFWYQVKLFNPAIAAGLRKVKNPGIYHFQMNWESMNPKTLKFMSKGHDPLKAIEAAKSVLDVGASFGSNYMCRFPRQDHENIAHEANFLTRAFHLGVGRMAVFSYSANGRDMISGSPERYQIDVTRNPANVWAKDTFGTDLDISFWQYDWEATQGTTDRIDYWLARLYGRIFTKVAYDASWQAAFSHLPLAILSLLTGRMGYIKRSWALFAIMRRQQTNGGFRIENNRLIRRTRIPGLTRALDMKVTDQDAELLRHVYLTTRENDLQEWLSKRMSEAEGEALLRRHEKLGTIVRMDGKVISVVHDPEYWAMQPSSEKAADVDTSLAVNYS